MTQIHHEVLIVGGGFGGYYAAHELSRHKISVAVIDTRGYQTFQPLLYQAATGLIEPDDLDFHLSEMKRVTSVADTVTAVDVAALAAEPDFPGMEVERSSARGVIARIPGTGDGPTLLLLGHTDVVPPGDRGAWSGDPFAPEIRGDRLIGRGACATLIEQRQIILAVRQAKIRGLLKPAQRARVVGVFAL